MSETIHVACNIDANYVKYCGVMLISLFENNKESTFDIHIVADTLPQEQVKVLESIIASYQNEVHFYFDSSHLVNNLPQIAQSHLSLAAYYRCFLSSILPDHLKTIIYLDCDLLVVSSVKELWELEISDYPLAAVVDKGCFKDKVYKRLGYDKRYSYFNTGVQLVNLEYLRKINMEKLVLDFMEQCNIQLDYYDQDILNCLFHKKKKLIPFRWNMQDGFYRTKQRMDINELSMEEALQNPAIIHFTGNKKPWHYECIHSLKGLYYKYLDMSPWKGERPPVDYAKWGENVLMSILISFKLVTPKYRKV